MYQLGGMIALIGLLLGALGAIWFFITVFRESIPWGILCLLTGVASLIFLVLYWRESRRPFFIWIGGTILAFAGGLMRNQLPW